MNTNFFIFLLAISCSFLSCTSTASKSEPKKEALPVTSELTEEEEATKVQEVVDGWIKLVDAGKYKEAYDQTGMMIRMAITSESWEKSLSATAEKQGGVTARELMARKRVENLPNAPKGIYYVVQNKIVTKKDGNFVEVIIVRLEDNNQFKVAGFFHQKM